MKFLTTALLVLMLAGCATVRQQDLDAWDGGLGLAYILFIFLGRQVIKRKQIAIRITIFLSLILVAIGYAEGSPLYVPVLLFWGLVWVFDAIVKRD